MMFWSDHMSGWAWFWMSVSTVAFWTLVGVGIYWLVRTARGQSERRPDADEILAERFARGELSATEFEEDKRILTRR